MKLLEKSSTYLVILLIIFACCTDETEGVRRVLRGRRTLTRQYFVGLGIPAWILIALLGVAEIIIGAALYFILQRIILNDDSKTAQYVPAPTTPTTTIPATATTTTPTTTTTTPTVAPATTTTTTTPAVQPATGGASNSYRPASQV